MKKQKRNALDAHATRKVAAEAICAPETVTRYLDGLPVRSTSALRITRALVKLGLDEFVRQQAA